MPLTSMKASSLKSAASTTSLSSAVRSGFKRGIKRKTSVESVDSLTRPRKHSRPAPSNISSSVVSDVDYVPTAAEERVAAEEWACTKASESQDIIDIDFDHDNLEPLEDELGMCASDFPVFSYLFQSLAEAQKSWRSQIYSFFSPVVTVQIHKGRVAHFFRCGAKKCKTSARGIRRYQDTTNKSSTANLRHHAARCFGKECVTARMNGESAPRQSGNIFSSFALQGQRPVTYSNRAHTNPELR
jgi:hypothetical protein